MRNIAVLQTFKSRSGAHSCDSCTDASAQLSAFPFLALCDGRGAVAGNNYLLSGWSRKRRVVVVRRTKIPRDSASSNSSAKGLPHLGLVGACTLESATYEIHRAGHFVAL
jgi:hypothetical protein